MNPRENFENLPIYLKGREIEELVRRILDLVPRDNEMLMEVASWMQADAANLFLKVAGAEGADLYDIRMENAAIIRKSARELVVQRHSFSMHGFEHMEYFDILLELVEEYRLLFIDWVASFDQWNYVIDRWGLFNPPGVDPHDKDPDDDLPFNPEGFFGGEE